MLGRARDLPVLRRCDDHAGDLGPVRGRGPDHRRGRRCSRWSSRSRSAILIGLFLVQSRGTAKVGDLFGPVILVYLAVLAALGRHQHPRSSRNPRQRSTRSGRSSSSSSIPKLAFLALGSVFLAVTGAETLYADMGHFGRKAIGFSWLTLVYPCLMLNYHRARARCCSAHPAAASNPFLPDGARLGAAAAGRASRRPRRSSPARR